MILKDDMNKIKMLSEYILNISEADKRRPRLSKDSVDDQINQILLKYESDCIVSTATIPEEIGEAYVRSIIRQQLTEADDDKDEDEDEGSQKPELGSPSGEEKEEEAEVESQTADMDDQRPMAASDPMTPKIDIKMFCGKVSRLATNYDALMDMPIAIVNMAYKYITQNYGQALADEYKEIMERDFDIELEHEDPTKPREIPIAVGGAATGLGGGGA